MRVPPRAPVFFWGRFSRGVGRLTRLGTYSLLCLFIGSSVYSIKSWQRDQLAIKSMKEFPKIPLALCPVPKEEDECDVEDDGNRRRP